MKAAVIHSIKESTKKPIQRKLSAEFSDSLCFLMNENGKILVSCGNFSLDNLVKKNHKLKEEVRLSRSDRESIDTAIKKVALHLRASIKDHQVKNIMATTPFRITKWSIFHTRLTVIVPKVSTDG